MSQSKSPKNSSSGKGSMLKGSLKLAGATLLSRVLGLVREQVLAAQFGAQGVTDAFLVAFRIPNLLRDMFAEGSFSAAFVPQFSEKYTKDPQQARIFLWSLFLVLGFLTLLISTLMIVFAEPLVSLFVDERFKSNASDFELTILLTRIMAPFFTFVSLAACLMGALNTMKVFFVPALAPSFFNISMIASMLALPLYLQDKGAHPALSLGLGVLFGGFLQFLLQFLSLLKHKFGPVRPKLSHWSEILKVFKLMSYGVISFGANQINLLLTTQLATSTVVGAVSWLGYSFRLFQFPVGILGVSLGGSHLVHFSEDWKAGREQEAIATLKFAYNSMLLVILGALAIMLPTTRTMVTLVFERGEFTHLDSAISANLLEIYLLGLPAYALYKLISPTFYTLGKEKVPVFCSLAGILFNITFCVVLVPHYGFRILALGMSLSMTLNVLLQSIQLARILNLPVNFFISSRVLKMLLSFGVSQILGWMVFRNYDLKGHNLLELLGIFSGMAVSLFGLYAVVLLLLGEKEALLYLKSKFRK